MQALKITNVAELRLRVGSTGTSAELQGYYLAGDGGGGNFYWDPLSIVADNGGTIFQVSTVVSGRWLRVFTGAVYSKWFGAKGDYNLNTGLGTDDTIAIQSFLDTAQLTNRQAIANNGDYLIETVYIPYGVDFNGEAILENNNLNCTTFTQKTTNDVFRFKANLNSGYYWFFGRISSFRINGNLSSATGKGIHCLDIANNKVLLQDITIVEDLIIRGLGEDGICCYGAMPAIFNRLKLLFNNGAGLRFIRYSTS
jgi:hypothetical protein